MRFLDLSEEDKKNYVWSQNLDQQRYINQASTEIKLDQISNKLIEKIEKDLALEISNFHENIDLAINHSIGSIKIPLALIDKKNGNFIAGIYLDTFKYFNSYHDYLLDKDIESFFHIKGYQIVRVNFLNWATSKNDVIKIIKKYYYQN